MVHNILLVALGKISCIYGVRYKEIDMLTRNSENGARMSDREEKTDWNVYAFEICRSKTWLSYFRAVSEQCESQNQFLLKNAKVNFSYLINLRIVLMRNQFLRRKWSIIYLYSYYIIITHSQADFGQKSVPSHLTLTDS